MSAPQTYPMAAVAEIASRLAAKMRVFFTFSASMRRRREALDADLQEAAEAGDAEACRRVLALGGLSEKNRSAALCFASLHGHAHCVEAILPFSNPEFKTSLALKLAARNGHRDCARILVAKTRSAADRARALQGAASTGHAGCVEELLYRYSDPRFEGSKALRCAVASGSLACVKLLLPVSDLSAMNFKAVEESLARGHVEISALLIANAPEWASAQMLSLARARAVEDGHSGLAALLTSLIEPDEIEQSCAPASEKEPGKMLPSFKHRL